ncbi:MAG: preprotein translocase subunit SecG [Candidatus Omnitrophica bacterium]|nr:preprotein translocase subunit SecG [Candidatus Omnitrophota bacterium]
MYALLIVIHVIVSVVLILVILLQAGRGGGLSDTFGISSTQTFFGTSAAKFLQKATSVSAVIFLLTCLSLAALSTHRSRSLMETQRVKKAIGGAETKAALPIAIPPVKQEAPKTE